MKKLKSLLLLMVLCIASLATGQTTVSSTELKFYSTDINNNVHTDAFTMDENNADTTILGCWVYTSGIYYSNDSLYVSIPNDNNFTLDDAIDTTVFDVGNVSKSPDSLEIYFNISLWNSTIINSNLWFTSFITATNNNNKFAYIADSIGFINDSLILLDVDTVSYNIDYTNAVVSLTLDSTNFSDTIGQHSVFILFNNNQVYHGFVEIRYNVVDGTVGLAENRLDDVEPLLVYPNPVVDILNVSSGELSNNSAKYIYNISGQLIMEFYTNSVNIKHLPKGVYILTNGNKKIKFIKK